MTRPDGLRPGGVRPDGARAEFLAELAARLRAAPCARREVSGGKGRGALVAEAAAFLKVSVPTIYRELKALGYGAERKTRSDAGTSCVSRDLALTAAGLIRKGTRANGKRTLTLNAAVEILEKNGLGPLSNAETGEARMPDRSTLARAMRRFGCHPDQLLAAGGSGPHSQLRSLHPNHVWQMDASVCVIFYLPKGAMAVLDERSYNERKPANLAKLGAERVIRWIVADHYSGCFFARYTLGSENARDAVSVLAEAMAERGGAQTCGDPFCGVPRILYTDPGPAFTAALTRRFLARLGVRQLTHAPGNARATGCVEVHQRIVEQGFEGRLRLYQAQSLADLNARLDAWRLAYNTEKIHSRHGKSRHAMWLCIAEDQLKKPQSRDLLLSLAVSEALCAQVRRDLTIALTLKGFTRQIYDVRGLPDVAIGEKLFVTVNPFSAPAVDVQKNGVVHTLEPISFDAAGFAHDAPVIGESYRAVADTPVDRARKDVDRADFTHINVFADVEAAPKRLWLTTRGRELAIARQANVEPTLDHVAAALDLRARLASFGEAWTPAHMARLRALYPDRVPQGALEELVHQLRSEDAEKTTITPFGAAAVQAGR